MGVYVGQVSGTTSGAGGYLASGWSTLSQKADQAFTEAMSIANSSAPFIYPSVQIPTPPATGATNVAISTAGAPNKPGMPTAPVNALTAPSFSAPSYSPGSAPSFSAVSPQFSFISAPSVTQPVSPGAAPVVSTPVLPASPSVLLPSVPTLRDLNLPAAPSILLPTFSATNPTGDLPELVQPNFVWSEAPYSEKLPQLSSKIAQYLAFDYEAAETAIWERGQERVERATNEAVLNLTNDFASRGFSLPTGSMLAAVNEARMKGAEARYDNARDAMIKAAELNTQKLTLAIQSGIQYESAWMNYQTQYAQRAFDAARMTVDITLKLFDAKVALFNARLSAYQTEAQVHRDLIQAELAKLETYKVQLEGQKLIGEMNMQDVELYKARLQGSLAEIELYKGQIAAVNALIEVDKNRLQGYATEVQAYKARIEANAAEYAAWGEAVRAEAVKAQIYETEVKAFATRVDAYKTGEDVKISQAKLQLDTNKLTLEAFQSSLANAELALKAYSSEVAALTQIYESDAKVYGTLIGAREAEAKVKVAAAGQDIEAYKTEASVLIERARVELGALEANTRTFIGRMQSAGSIVSQLAASAMSAFNLSAGTREDFSLSVSNSLQESHSYSGT